MPRLEHAEPVIRQGVTRKLDEPAKGAAREAHGRINHEIRNQP